MVVTRYGNAEPRYRCVLPFEAEPAEVGLLRRATAQQLCKWGVPSAAGEAELVVTELATNVIKHVGEGTAATLVLERRGVRIRLEVHDKSQKEPLIGRVACEDECGRGLHMIAALAVDWGIVLTVAGKAVWCEIPAGNLPCQRIERAVGALENYQHAHGGTALRRGGLEQSAVELITDLLHWSAALGRDPDDVLDRAQMHFEAETDAA